MAPGMKTHSDSSFYETKEVTILKDLLESKKSIKTFFGENEKTPNHDGFFELVNKDTRQPKKQFIVQIKKCDSLAANKDGTYSFSFETPFLFYVKEKVTESPAIIFIVELNTRRCFYKYLSDSYLMNLDFEKKEHISLRLFEQDQIIDIDSFYNILLEISVERNAKFVNKTPKQIEEMREAVEWLNKAMEDVHFLKELIPNYWRFGIASSYTITVSIKDQNGKDVQPNREASAFGLYLQCKNDLDCGVQDFVNDKYFNTMFDFTNTLTPLKYAQDVFLSLLETYFNSYIIAPKYLSDAVLNEIVFSMLDKMAHMGNGIYSKPNTSQTYYKNEELVENAKNHLLKFYSYFIHIVNDDVTGEELFKKKIFLAELQRPAFINPGVDLIELIASFAGEDFKKWDGGNKDFNLLMGQLRLFKNDYTLFCLTLLELERRGISKVNRVWDICNDNDATTTNMSSKKSLCTTNNRTHGNSIYSRYDDNKIILAFKKLLIELPVQYSFCYEKMFDKNYSFKYLTDVIVKLVAHDENAVMPYCLWLRTIKFDSPQEILIKYDENICNSNDLVSSEEMLSKKIISSSLGCFPIELFETRLPLYHSIKVLLWQGIISHYGLEKTTYGVIVGNIKQHLF